MILKNLLFPSFLLPFLAAAVVYGITSWSGSKSAPAESASKVWRPGAGLAVAVAFASSYVALTGWPRWLPVEATQRLFFVVLLTGVISLVLAGRINFLLRSLLACLILGGLLFWILQPLIQNSWSTTQTILWLVGLTGLGLAFVWVFGSWIESAKEQQEGSWSVSSLLPIFVLLTLLGGSSVLLGISQSARLAQLLGATTSAAFAVELTSRLLKRPGLAAIDGLVLSTILLGLAVCGYFYAELTALPATLAALGFGFFGGTTRAKAPVRLLAIVPLLVALLIAGQAYLNQPEDPYAGYFTEEGP